MHRTRGLYQFYSCFIFSELIAPAISSVTANISSSLPFIISYLLLFSTFPLLTIMPQGDTLSAATTTNTEQNEQNEHAHGLPESRSVLRTFLHASADQYRLLKFVFSSRNMRLAVAIFLVGTFRGISLRALIQYASARFGWKLSTASRNLTNTPLVSVTLICDVDKWPHQRSCSCQPVSIFYHHACPDSIHYPAL